MKAMISITGVLGLGATVMGFLFKILHLPGADELMLLGIGCLLILFLPLMLIKRWKKS